MLGHVQTLCFLFLADANSHDQLDHEEDNEGEDHAEPEAEEGEEDYELDEEEANALVAQVEEELRDLGLL